jgi:tetratricopeptide (TPR) repeat protein
MRIARDPRAVGGKGNGENTNFRSGKKDSVNSTLNGAYAQESAGAEATRRLAEYFEKRSLTKGVMGVQLSTNYINDDHPDAEARGKYLLCISKVFSKTPAHREGVQAGDIMLSLNGVNTYGFIDESLAIEAVAGRPGEVVHLGLLRGREWVNKKIVLGDNFFKTQKSVWEREQSLITVGAGSKNEVVTFFRPDDWKKSLHWYQALLRLVRQKTAKQNDPNFLVGDHTSASVQKRISQLERLHEYQPTSPKALFVRFNSLAASNNFSRALPAAKRLEEVAPKLVAASHMFANNYGWVLLNAEPNSAKSRKKALRYIRRALKNNPKQKNTLNTLAFGLMLEGKHDEALRTVEKSMKGAGAVDGAYLEVRILLRLGRTQEALKKYMQAVQRGLQRSQRKHAEKELRDRGLLR